MNQAAGRGKRGVAGRPNSNPKVQSVLKRQSAGCMGSLVVLVQPSTDLEPPGARGVRLDNIIPPRDTKEEWRQKFLDYYATNAPEKGAMVTDALMDKWVGKYEKLFTGMCSKYGEPGHPIVPAPKAKPKAKRRESSSGGKSTLNDYREDFERLIAAAAPAGASGEDALSVVDAKALNAANGIETSSFTVCTRIRPMFESEYADNYCCVVPGSVSGTEIDHTEQALVFIPKLSIQGGPKITKAQFKFDYTFGPDASNASIHAKVAPVQTALPRSCFLSCLAFSLTISLSLSS